MRIFLTGGTGYVGSAVLDALVRAGHHVDALVRNRDKANDVRARGARPSIGDLARPETYSGVSADADGIVHAAADEYARRHQLDALAIETLLDPRMRRRFFIYTSG